MAAAYGVSSGLNDPDKSSSGPSSTSASVAAHPSTPPCTAMPLQKSSSSGGSGGEKKQSNNSKIMNGSGRHHHRSSSLENNIFMAGFSSISPFHTGGPKQPPQLSIAEPLRMSPSASSLSLSNSNAASPFNHHHQHFNPRYNHHNHSTNNYHSLQPMSLGHMPPSSSSNSTSLLAVNEAVQSPQQGQKSSFRGSLGGQSPLQPYYGTLKSKREQKRMQMGTGGGGQMGGGGGMTSQLQQRISSVDDLRQGAGGGNCNSISKSQVRLMREMFEQQQQKLNSKNFNSSEGGKMLKSNGMNSSTTSLNRKYSNEETGGMGTGGQGNAMHSSSLMNLNGGGGDSMDSKPPAIQPCSGVLEITKQQLIKPIAFKPIPFPADSRFLANNSSNPANNINSEANDRYGSTPSLNPPTNNYNLKFGSTHDLRNNFNTIGSRKAYAYNLINYDSMESISPDSICSSQSTLKSMGQYQADLLDTPSPSDSGISELEAALRDRDSELAYLRQTMEHNEKVIFRVHQDKERNWEDEIKRMRQIHAQRIQKFEQIAMMQSFQLRQTKKRHQEEVGQLQARVKDVERKAELQNNEIMGHKVNEKELREQCSDMMEENELMRKLVNELRSRLEESEWSNCQKNGETALLKTQLKDAQAEVMSKDQEMAQLRMELKMAYGDRDQLVLTSNEPEESTIIITTHPSMSSSSSSSSPISINHSDDEKLKDDLQLSHLNRIIILKDQIIMAMTNEMQKLKKEVADLGNYEGMAPGRTVPQNKRKDQGSPQTQQPLQQIQPSSNESQMNSKLCNKENVILGDYHDLLNNLKNSEDFLKCTSKEKPTLEELKNVLLNNQFGTPAQGGRERVAINHLNPEICDDNKVSEPKRTNLDSVAAAGAPIAAKSEDRETVDRLTMELAEMKRTFEEERKKWTDEKEKVLVYQRQLQRNYLQMCKRNESLEEKMQRKDVFRETGEPAISI